MDYFNLMRFVQAHETTYQRALQELCDGRKRSHWMWFIFPQLRGLGHSKMSDYYGIYGIEEALAYIQHPLLNTRMREVCETILSLQTCNAIEIFGDTDSKKLKSSMTLFDIVAPNDIFAEVLLKFFQGKRCKRTLSLQKMKDNYSKQEKTNKTIMESRYTPKDINKLAENEIFVFGSNPSGYHVGGSAKIAVKKFNAVYGQSEGLQGQSYAIPTKFPEVDMIRPHVEKFIMFARKHHELTFLVTPIGCGNAGYTPYEIAPLFTDAYYLDNVLLPECFVSVILNQPRFMDYPLNSWDSQKDFIDLKRTLEQSNLHKSGDVRDILIRAFHNTVQIVNSGFYLTEEGKIVRLPNAKARSNRAFFYENEFSVNNVPALSEETKFEIVENDCLEEAIRLKREGYYPAVLNMASRQNPGGGVLHGSMAQEESIFRRTDLFKSLFQFSSYAENFGVEKAEQQYPLDRNFGGIYSPDVIIFRDSEINGCRLLNQPEYISIVSVAAMNRPELTSCLKISSHLVDGVKNKMRTIFRIALRHRHDSLILGAWGCGAFRNPPKHIASLFHEVLKEKEFKNKFRKIVFAIIEDKNSRKAHNPEGNLLPFQKEFC